MADSRSDITYGDLVLDDAKYVRKPIKTVEEPENVEKKKSLFDEDLPPPPPKKILEDREADFRRRLSGLEKLEVNTGSEADIANIKALFLYEFMGKRHFYFDPTLEEIQGDEKQEVKAWGNEEWRFYHWIEKLKQYPLASLFEFLDEFRVNDKSTSPQEFKQRFFECSLQKSHFYQFYVKSPARIEQNQQLDLKSSLSKPLLTDELTLRSSILEKLSGVKLAEPKPVEVKPVEVKPIEAKPNEAKPIEAKPAEEKIEKKLSDEEENELARQKRRLAKKNLANEFKLLDVSWKKLQSYFRTNSAIPSVTHKIYRQSFFQLLKIDSKDQNRYRNYSTDYLFFTLEECLKNNKPLPTSSEEWLAILESQKENDFKEADLKGILIHQKDCPVIEEFRKQVAQFKATLPAQSSFEMLKAHKRHLLYFLTGDLDYISFPKLEIIEHWKDADWQAYKLKQDIIDKYKLDDLFKCFDQCYFPNFQSETAVKAYFAKCLSFLVPPQNEPKKLEIFKQFTKKNALHSNGSFKTIEQEGKASVSQKTELRKAITHLQDQWAALKELSIDQKSAPSYLEGEARQWFTGDADYASAITFQEEKSFNETQKKQLLFLLTNDADYLSAPAVTEMKEWSDTQWQAYKFKQETITLFSLDDIFAFVDTYLLADNQLKNDQRAIKAHFTQFLKFLIPDSNAGLQQFKEETLEDLQKLQKRVEKKKEMQSAAIHPNPLVMKLRKQQFLHEMTGLDFYLAPQLIENEKFKKVDLLGPEHFNALQELKSGKPEKGKLYVEAESHTHSFRYVTSLTPERFKVVEDAKGKRKKHIEHEVQVVKTEELGIPKALFTMFALEDPTNTARFLEILAKRGHITKWSDNDWDDFYIFQKYSLDQLFNLFDAFVCGYKLTPDRFQEEFLAYLKSLSLPENEKKRGQLREKFKITTLNNLLKAKFNTLKEQWIILKKQYSGFEIPDSILALYKNRFLDIFVTQKIERDKFKDVTLDDLFTEVSEGLLLDHSEKRLDRLLWDRLWTFAEHSKKPSESKASYFEEDDEKESKFESNSDVKDSPKEKLRKLAISQCAASLSDRGKFAEHLRKWEFARSFLNDSFCIVPSLQDAEGWSDQQWQDYKYQRDILDHYPLGDLFNYWSRMFDHAPEGPQVDLNQLKAYFLQAFKLLSPVLQQEELDQFKESTIKKLKNEKYRKLVYEKERIQNKAKQADSNAAFLLKKELLYVLTGNEFYLKPVVIQEQIDWNAFYTLQSYSLNDLLSIYDIVLAQYSSLDEINISDIQDDFEIALRKLNISHKAYKENLQRLKTSTFNQTLLSSIAAEIKYWKGIKNRFESAEIMPCENIYKKRFLDLLEIKNEWQDEVLRGCELDKLFEKTNELITLYQKPDSSDELFLNEYLIQGLMTFAKSNPSEKKESKTEKAVTTANKMQLKISATEFKDKWKRTKNKNKKTEEFYKRLFLSVFTNNPFKAEDLTPAEWRAYTMQQSILENYTLDELIEQFDFFVLSNNKLEDTDLNKLKAYFAQCLALSISKQPTKDEIANCIESTKSKIQLKKRIFLNSKGGDAKRESLNKKQLLYLMTGNLFFTLEVKDIDPADCQKWTDEKWEQYRICQAILQCFSIDEIVGYFDDLFLRLHDVTHEMTLEELQLRFFTYLESLTSSLTIADDPRQPTYGDRLALFRNNIAKHISEFALQSYEEIERKKVRPDEHENIWEKEKTLFERTLESFQARMANLPQLKFAKVIPESSSASAAALKHDFLTIFIGRLPQGVKWNKARWDSFVNKQIIASLALKVLFDYLEQYIATIKSLPLEVTPAFQQGFSGYIINSINTKQLAAEQAEAKKRKDTELAEEKNRKEAELRSIASIPLWRRLLNFISQYFSKNKSVDKSVDNSIPPAPKIIISSPSGPPAPIMKKPRNSYKEHRPFALQVKHVRPVPAEESTSTAPSTESPSSPLGLSPRFINRGLFSPTSSSPGSGHDPASPSFSSRRERKR